MIWFILVGRCFVLLGKNHIITNATSVVLLGTVLVFGKTYKANSVTQKVVAPVCTTVYDYVTNHQFIPVLLFYIISGLFFLLGSLLPDIDSERSLLGKYIHLPVEHRTWTHAVWAPLLFFTAGHFCRPFFWLGLGYILHLFWDSLSYAGICWFYPVSNYKRHTNSIKIKKRHRFKLYRVGTVSEYILVILFLVLTAVIVYLLYPFINS